MLMYHNSTQKFEQTIGVVLSIWSSLITSVSTRSRTKRWNKHLL